MNKREQRLRALQNQIRRLKQRIAQLKKMSLRFSWARLAIFLTGLGLAFVVYWISVTASWGILGVGLLVFNIVARFHRKIEKGLRRHEIWLELKQSQAGRMQLNWAEIPEISSVSPSPTHLFEIDLDITGKYSLHQLLDISISQNGSNRLRNWLLTEVPDPEKICERQHLIHELKNMTRFRDKLLLNFKLVSRERLEGKEMLNWLEKISFDKSFLKVLIPQAILLFVFWVLLVFNLMNDMPPFWLIPLFLYLISYYSHSKLIRTLLDDTVFIDSELKKSIAIFKYIENYEFEPESRLARLCQRFYDSSSRPTIHLKKLTRIMIAIGLRGNYILAILLNLIWPWDYFWSYRLNKEKKELKHIFPGWLDCCFELEALIGLANFAWLNPAYSFPNIMAGSPAEDGNIPFQVKNLGHPLIPEDVKICNDFQMNHPGEISLITGSNMSGKSTFLRTLGINLCLANAGAPVNATQFNTRLFRIFTCIKINDSLTNGVSQFYAEVKRLKYLLDLLEQEYEFPIFFLIDEIYKGTNNRERLIGSRSFISSLMHRNALGVVSTHDLDLTRLAENLTGFRNFHFREEVKAGKMVFDYQLKTGPCPTTNALKIMQMEGLPVVFDNSVD